MRYNVTMNVNSILKSKRAKYIGLGLLIVILLFLVHKQEASNLSLVVHSSQEGNTLYDISIEYPQFSGVKKDFNKRIQVTVEESLQKFKDEVQEVEAGKKSEEGKNGAAYTFTTSWSPEQLSPRMISFVLHTVYFTGGAHGGHDIYTFNYDGKIKKEITLDAIFNSVPNYLNRISDFVANDLKDQLNVSSEGERFDESVLVSGTAPLAKNFTRFTLGTDSITFHFPEYQVAPYAAGEQKVTMPLSYIIPSEQQ